MTNTYVEEMVRGAFVLDPENYGYSSRHEMMYAIRNGEASTDLLEDLSEANPNITNAAITDYATLTNNVSDCDAIFNGMAVIDDDEGDGSDAALVKAQTADTANDICTAIEDGSFDPEALAALALAATNGTSLTETLNAEGLRALLETAWQAHQNGESDTLISRAPVFFNTWDELDGDYSTVFDDDGSFDSSYYETWFDIAGACTADAGDYDGMASYAVLTWEVIETRGFDYYAGLDEESRQAEFEYNWTYVNETGWDHESVGSGIDSFIEDYGDHIVEISGAGGFNACAEAEDPATCYENTYTLPTNFGGCTENCYTDHDEMTEDPMHLPGSM